MLDHAAFVVRLVTGEQIGLAHSGCGGPDESVDDSWARSHRWDGWSAAGAEPPVLVACSDMSCIFVLFNGCYGLPAAWTWQTDHYLGLRDSVMAGLPRPFLNKPEQLRGPLSPHCKAGLGRKIWNAVPIVSSVSARMSHACGGTQRA